MRKSLSLLVLAAFAQQEPLRNDRKAEFLLTADVVEAVRAGSGVTGSWRLSLRNEALTHDAHFQSVDERAMRKRLSGRVELGFVDSYRYNIAAYRIAELLGLDDMVPVSVERRWRKKPGAMTWWVDDVMMDEIERIKRGLLPPDKEMWRRQLNEVKLFTHLTYDTDRNQSNVLITRSWRVWIIDFTRAFRPWTKLPLTERPDRCDREVYRRLRSLTREQLSEEVEGLLKRREIEGMLARRDLLVAHFESLIRERGENEVLY